MNFGKKLAAGILTIILLLQPGLVFGAVPFAQDSSQTEEDGIRTASASYVNPMYRQGQEEQELEEQSDAVTDNAFTAMSSSPFTSNAQCANYIKKQLLQRKKKISFAAKGSVIGNWNTWLTDVMDKAMEDTGKNSPREGDYLRWNVLMWRADMTLKNGILTVTYTVIYATTLTQEAYVNQQIPAVVKKLNLTGKSEYQKAKMIYDWVTSNVTYDYAGLYADDPAAYSAYKALARKTAVCQGYATLMYRLMRESGLSCRVISGYANGDRHGWNIVKIGSYYYNMDATWDAGAKTYRYFLKGSSDFPDHAADSSYRTTAFSKLHPLSLKKYNPSSSQKLTKPGKTVLGKTVATDYNKIKITWTKASGASGYYIYRKTAGGSYKKIGSTTKNYYVDNKAVFGRAYTYTVRAYKNYGLSVVMGDYNKKGISGKTTYLKKPQLYPSMPPGISSKIAAGFAWNKVNGAQGYIVYRKEAGKKYVRLAKVSPSTYKYYDYKIKNGKTYTYAVRAYRKVGKKVYYSSYMTFTVEVLV